MPKILLLDNDSDARKRTSQLLQQAGCTVADAPLLMLGEEKLAKESFDCLLIDETLPDKDVRGFLAELGDIPGVPPALVMVSDDSKIDWMDEGAWETIRKPVSEWDLKKALRKLQHYRGLLQGNEWLAQKQFLYHPAVMAGESKNAEELRTLLRQIAPSNTSVMVAGEAGAGQAEVAYAIFHQSQQQNLLFLSCSVPEQSSPEVLQQAFANAEQGCLILEDVQALTSHAQAVLLQLLKQESRTRVIATCSLAANEEKPSSLASELFYALNIIPVKVLPLRERKEDLAAMAEELRRVLNRKHGKRVTGFGDKAMDALRQYSWPGNFIELSAMLERAILTSRNDAVLEPDDLRLQAGEAKKTSDLFIPETLEALEKKYIFTVLEKYEQNRTRAAEVLGISVRTLRNKLREYRGEAAEGGEEQE